jgi:hypothetical protein
MSSAEIAAELARLDAEDAQIQRRLDHLEVARELLPLTSAATNANPLQHFAECHMPAANALMHLRRSEDQLPMQMHAAAPMQMHAAAPMQMHASAPMQMHAAAPVENIRLVQRDEPRQRILNKISRQELQDICYENNISPVGLKKELSDIICRTFPPGVGVGLIEAKLLARGKSGGKSHRRKSRHRRRKTNRAH